MASCPISLKSRIVAVRKLALRLRPPHDPLLKHALPAALVMLRDAERLARSGRCADARQYLASPQLLPRAKAVTLHELHQFARGREAREQRNRHERGDYGSEP